MISDAQTSEKTKTRDIPPWLGRIGWYFVHGFLYSLLTSFLGVFVFIILFPIGIAFAVIGLILIIIVLFLVVGWVNKTLSRLLWDIHCSGSFRSIFGHGVMLVIVLFLFFIPIAAYQTVFQESVSDPIVWLAVQIVAIIPYSIIYGFLGRIVAEQFLDSKQYIGGSMRHRRGSTLVDFGTVEPTPVQGTCPHCSQKHWYDESGLSQDRSITCKNCGERYIIPLADGPSEDDGVIS